MLDSADFNDNMQHCHKTEAQWSKIQSCHHCHRQRIYNTFAFKKKKARKQY